jgi:hypothetical protein
MRALAVARALGDHQFKDPQLPQPQQMVSPVPDVTFVDRNFVQVRPLRFRTLSVRPHVQILLKANVRAYDLPQIRLRSACPHVRCSLGCFALSSAPFVCVISHTWQHEMVFLFLFFGPSRPNISLSPIQFVVGVWCRPIRYVAVV